MPPSAGSPASALPAIHSPRYLPASRTAVLGGVKGVSLQETSVDLLPKNSSDLADTTQFYTLLQQQAPKFNHPLCKEALYLFQTNPHLVSPNDPSSSTAALGEQEFYIQLTCCLCVLVTHQYNPPQMLFLQRKEPQPF